eukprot:908204-Amorphochlora_amoeboformis.AAC.2
MVMLNCTMDFRVCLFLFGRGGLESSRRFRFHGRGVPNVLDIGTQLNDAIQIPKAASCKTRPRYSFKCLPIVGGGLLPPLFGRVVHVALHVGYIYRYNTKHIRVGRNADLAPANLKVGPGISALLDNIRALQTAIQPFKVLLSAHVQSQHGDR